MLIFLIPLFFLTTLAQDVIVSTPMGNVKGFHKDYDDQPTGWRAGKADIFLGIPFAQPPIGNLRYQRPQPLTKYSTDPLDATQYKAACEQPTDPAAKTPMCRIQPLSEDCLHLNVFTPNATSTTKYPVMVWIHGGGLMADCASTFGYQGATRNIVSRGIVLVVIQYRLGVHGFFTTNTTDFPPNRGLLDQLEALKWVKNNIAFFGGDPKSVTIFGESSGGSSVNAHLYSPLSKDYFIRAIMQSGALYMHTDGPIAHSNYNEIVAKTMCNLTLTSNPAQLKACMNALKPGAYLAVNLTNTAPPVYRDEYFLPKDSKANHIPVMIGSMRDESALDFFQAIDSNRMTFDDFNQSIIRTWFEQVDMVSLYANDPETTWRIVKDGYTLSGTRDDDAVAWVKAGLQILSSASSFQYVAKEVHLQVANGNSELYLYEQAFQSFYYQSPTTEMVAQRLDGYQPVPHTDELPVLWFLWADPMYDGTYDRSKVTPFDYQMADNYGTWWTNFAKYGKPTMDNLWQPVSLKDGKLQHFRIDHQRAGGLQMENGFHDRDYKIFQVDLRTKIPVTPTTPMTPSPTSAVASIHYILAFVFFLKFVLQ